jgi:aminoglycoside phosphotransferase (APT) family kinase protein
MDNLSSSHSATAAEVSALLEGLFGATPADIEKMSFGDISVTFGASVGGETLIVRTHQDPQTFSGTQRTLDALRALGIPVPHLIAVDLSCRNVRFAYMITERLPGRDLRFEIRSMTPSQLSALAEQIMDFERRAGTLGSPGRYGYAPVGAVPPHSTWLDAMASDARISSRLPLELQPLLTAIERAIERHGDYIRGVRPVCFLDDLTTKNVIVHQGKLSGVVDFDCVCYGDPLWHVALTKAAIAADVGDRYLGYVDELCRYGAIGSDLSPIIDLYAAMHGIEFLHDQPQETSEAAAMRERVRRWTVSSNSEPGIGSQG